MQSCLGFVYIPSIFGILLAVAGKSAADAAADEQVVSRIMNNYVHKALPELAQFTDFVCGNPEALDAVVPTFLSLSPRNARFGHLGFKLLICRISLYNKPLTIYLRLYYPQVINDPSLTQEDYTFWSFFKDIDDHGDAILRLWRAKADPYTRFSPTIRFLRDRDVIYRDVFAACNRARPQLEATYNQSKELQI